MRILNFGAKFCTCEFSAQRPSWMDENTLDECLRMVLSEKLEFFSTKIRCILWRGVSKALDLYLTSSVTQHLVTENRGKSAKGRWSKRIVYLLEPLWNLRHLWAESLNIQEGIQLERCKSVFELMVAVSFWKKCFKWKRFVYVLYTRKRNNLTLI